MTYNKSNKGTNRVKLFTSTRKIRFASKMRKKTAVLNTVNCSNAKRTKAKQISIKNYKPNTFLKTSARLHDKEITAINQTLNQWNFAKSTFIRKKRAAIVHFKTEGKRRLMRKLKLNPTLLSDMQSMHKIKPSYSSVCARKVISDRLVNSYVVNRKLWVNKIIHTFNKAQSYAKKLKLQLGSSKNIKVTEDNLSTLFGQACHSRGVEPHQTLRNLSFTDGSSYG